MNTRRGFLKGLAAVVMGVSLSLPALRKDAAALAPQTWRTWNEYMHWRGNFGLYKPSQLKCLSGIIDSFEASS